MYFERKAYLKELISAEGNGMINRGHKTKRINEREPENGGRT